MKTRLVPECDFLFLKKLRINSAQGYVIINLSPEAAEQEGVYNLWNNEDNYTNAEILREYYGMNEQGVLELTGCYLEERKDIMGSEKKKIAVIKIEFFDGSKFLCRRKKGYQKLLEDIINQKREKLHTLSVKEQSLIMAKMNSTEGMARITNVEIDEVEYLKVTKIAQI